MNSSELKALFNAKYQRMKANSQRTRLWRAISWISRAEQEPDDPDAAFLFLWMAFNSLYAVSSEEQLADHRMFKNFLVDIVRQDKQGRLQETLVNLYSDHVLRNKFVFRPFWDEVTGRRQNTRWQQYLGQEALDAETAIRQGDTAHGLLIIFDRLYLLRNQLIHGAATHGSSLNRSALNSAHVLLSVIVPEMTHILIKHPKIRLGPIFFPVLKEDEASGGISILE